jgi:hypothetical protein
LGAVGLAVTGWTRDIGQKILQSCLQTENSSSPNYVNIFFLIAYLEEALVRNIMIKLCIKYIIIICIDDNNAVLNNNYGRFQDLILFFKIPMGARKNFLEIYRQFGHAPSKRFTSPGLEE